MKLLAVDTSTEACSAALLVDGVVSHRYQLAPREHSHLILKMIDELFSEENLTVAELDAVAFGRGPGSFMGIRIAAGIVQGIAFAHNIPVVPVSTLAALSMVAMQQSGSKHILAAIDARMNEVYWGAYSRISENAVELIGEECVIAPTNIPAPEEGDWVAAGTGWSSYNDVMKSSVRSSIKQTIDDCFPSATAIAHLAAEIYKTGNHVQAAEAVPVYLRDNVASKPKTA